MTIVLYLIIGAAAGLLGSLMGVGGGILLMPIFLFILKMEAHRAVATSLTVVVITALSSTLNNTLTADKYVDWKLAIPIGIGAALAAWFGSDLMKSLSNQTLVRLFGVVLVAAGLRALFAK